MTYSTHRRHYLMCRPTHFAVSYEINPWMDTSRPVDTPLALSQWERLRDAIGDLGHVVEEIDPIPGLPDMVYAANGATIVDAVAYSARFRYPERAAEGPAYLTWLADHGYVTHTAEHVNEGQGDFLVAGSTILAGKGPRTGAEAHAEAERLLGGEVLGLGLVDPRFYHLDTALSVLRGGVAHRDPDAEVLVAYYPPAFDGPSLEILRDRFPDAVIATDADAEALGLNLVADGTHAIMTPHAPHLAGALAERGLDVIGVDTSELLRGGGGAKCCTLEIGWPTDRERPGPVTTRDGVVDGRTGPHRTAPASHLVHNYAPLPVTIATAEGSWVTDTSGRRYLDMLAGYSALNFGHRHPALVEAAHHQLERTTLTSRAFGHDLLEPFADRLAALIGPLTRGGASNTTVLPMNTGAEAVESAVKAVRKWGYDVRGIPADRATIVVAGGNFHGRTTTIVSFSDDADARRGFGPYTPGFRVVPFGDARAAAAAIDETTVAVLMEPVQGEAGVIVPPADFWPTLRTVCDDAGVLLVADEIQSGLGRTGTTLATETWGVRADLVTLGKALGGGIVPVSAVVGRADVLGVLTPGTHGSTFGGNPLACAVALAVLDLLDGGEPQAAARALGSLLRERLTALADVGLLAGVRSLGAWAGIDLPRGDGRALCEALLVRGVLAKDTHGATIRLAPPLTMSPTDMEHGLAALTDALGEVTAAP